jgi:membrane protease subunit HflK
MPVFLRAAAAVFLVLYLASGYYTVAPTEQAIVLRFGKAVRMVADGPHYRLPWPVEREVITPVLQTFATSAGFRMVDDQLQRQPLPFEIEWLTGDRNLVNIRVVITFRVDDQEDYLFATADDRRFLIRWAVEAALTEMMSDMTIDDVFSHRIQVASSVRERAQELLDKYRAGVDIREISPKEVEAPGPVWSAFNRANQAKAEIDQRIREARKTEYTLLENARADARAAMDQAQAEREELIARARGRASAFLDLESSYRESPEGTRDRLYQETLREILSRVRVIQAGDAARMEIFSTE